MGAPGATAESLEMIGWTLFFEMMTEKGGNYITAGGDFPIAHLGAYLLCRRPLEGVLCRFGLPDRERKEGASEPSFEKLAPSSNRLCPAPARRILFSLEAARRLIFSHLPDHD